MLLVYGCFYRCFYTSSQISPISLSNMATYHVLYYDARGLGTNVKTVLLVQTCMSHEIVYHMRVSLLWSPFLAPGEDSQYANYDWLIFASEYSSKLWMLIGFLLLLLFFKHVYSALYTPVKSKVKLLVTRSCLTVCSPMDCGPPGCSVHEISQARMLEWVAIFFSSGSSQPRNWTRISWNAGNCLLSESSGKPHYIQVPVLNINHLKFKTIL